ncbi:Ankyrin-3 [Metarhizium anisopliae]|nr:Ankyrin-3 [Metarhizium anisopliae]
MNQQQLISWLADAGADPNSTADGANIACALIEAATCVDLAGVLKALLEKGADPNGRGAALHHLGSPAHSVYRRGPKQCFHETGIRLLLQHGASFTVQDELGNTPLHYAAFGSNLHIFSLYTTVLPVDSLHGNALKSIKNDSGQTLLHWAGGGKKIDILRLLLSSGANVHAANDNDGTPLMSALHSPVSCNSDKYLCAAVLQNTAGGKNSPRSWR